MKSERKSIENEYCRIACRFCSSVGEIFRYTSVHISSEMADVCGSDERELRSLLSVELFCGTQKRFLLVSWAVDRDEVVRATWVDIQDSEWF
jgi:hypothetical protein